MRKFKVKGTKAVINNEMNPKEVSFYDLITGIILQEGSGK